MNKSKEKITIYNSDFDSNDREIYACRKPVARYIIKVSVHDDTEENYIGNDMLNNISIIEKNNTSMIGRRYSVCDLVFCGLFMRF